jgi:hypothetical protein
VADSFKTGGSDLTCVTPDPGRPGTEIAFELPRECEVNLAVYDVTGRRVITLHDGVRAAGSHAISWPGGAFSRTRRVVVTNEAQSATESAQLC